MEREYEPAPKNGGDIAGFMIVIGLIGGLIALVFGEPGLIMHTLGMIGMFVIVGVVAFLGIKIMEIKADIGFLRLILLLLLGGGGIWLGFWMVYTINKNF